MYEAVPRMKPRVRVHVMGEANEVYSSHVIRQPL
jgi:hypothetical protein